jgi:hypothetical protein
MPVLLVVSLLLATCGHTHKSVCLSSLPFSLFHQKFCAHFSTFLGVLRTPPIWIQNVELSLIWQRIITNLTSLLTGYETDHSPPFSAEVKECVELYLHCPITLPLPCRNDYHMQADVKLLFQQLITCLVYSLFCLQAGGCPDHVPSAWHVRSLRPTTWKPCSQL